MLRLLYQDLYGQQLANPNEVTREIITHLPELEVRNDTRRYLEFVVNRFGLNPQPRAAVLVEGASEVRAVGLIFERYIGLHPGKLGIELIDLKGVGTATGGRKGRFKAIIRLIDYLHHHQTFAFLILDNENDAKRLEAAVTKGVSIHHSRRYVTRREYIRIWKVSFEFDNFSCGEIAAAMNELANGGARFSRSEVVSCKKGVDPGACLSALYRQKAGHDLPKIKLNEILVQQMLSGAKKGTRITSRPIVKILERVERLAALNHLPINQELWERNQASKYLGKRRRG